MNAQRKKVTNIVVERRLRQCDKANATISQELHRVYLEAIDAGIICKKCASVRCLEEFIHTPDPEGPGFRTYSE